MVAWWLGLAVSAVVYLVITIYVLPKIILRKGYLDIETKDRGLENLKDKKGRLIVFEPSTQARGVIKQYILDLRNKITTIVCKVDASVRYVDFDVTVYNGLGRPFGVVNVTCPIGESGFTQAAELPSETAFVSVRLNSADEKKYANGAFSCVTWKNFAVYVALATLLTVAEAVLVRLCVGHLFGGIFSEGFFAEDWSMLLALGICASVAVCLLAGAAVLERSRQKKKIMKGIDNGLQSNLKRKIPGAR